VQNLTDDKIRILVVQTAFLGDIILTTPLLNALKTAFPDSHLALLTTPVGKEALSGSAELDEILSYDKNGADQGLRAFFQKVKELRGKSFGLGLSPHRSFRTALLLALSRIPVLVGFKGSALSRIYHFRMERPEELHEVERNLKLLLPVTALPENFSAQIKLPMPKDFEPARFGVKPGDKPLIGFAPGSAWETKRWPAEKYAELARLLSKKLNAKILLLGDDKDAELCSEIDKLSSISLLNLAGKTGLKQLFGIISKLDLLVSNDSAPVHIASAFSIPTVVIFGPTVPAFGFGPWKNPHRIIQRELPCRPCHHHGPRECPEEHFKCMMAITAEEVFSAANELLRERNPRPAG